MKIELDDETIERLEKRAKMYNFDSTNEYTKTLIRTVLDELDRIEDDGDVKDRLEDLGYL